MKLDECAPQTIPSNAAVSFSNVLLGKRLCAYSNLGVVELSFEYANDAYPCDAIRDGARWYTEIVRDTTDYKQAIKLVQNDNSVLFLNCNVQSNAASLEPVQE